MNEKWILVTGASSGIGLVLSKKLLESGYHVILTARNVLSTKDELNIFPEEMYRLLTCDLSKTENIKGLAQEVLTKAGKISGLVHCAGITSVKPVSMVKKSELEQLFNLNVYSIFDLFKFFSKDKYCNQNSSFVMISSLSTEEGAVGRSAYAASKGALEGLLKPTAAELVKKGLRLNIVSPGIVKTPMTEAYLNKLPNEKKEEIIRSYPMGLGNPEDVANMIEFLLSEKSKWITGQKFIMDGGHLLFNNQ